MMHFGSVICFTIKNPRHICLSVGMMLRVLMFLIDFFCLNPKTKCSHLKLRGVASVAFIKGHKWLGTRTLHKQLHLQPNRMPAYSMLLRKTMCTNLTRNVNGPATSVTGEQFQVHDQFGVDNNWLGASVHNSESLEVSFFFCNPFAHNSPKWVGSSFSKMFDCNLSHTFSMCEALPMTGGRNLAG